MLAIIEENSVINLVEGEFPQIEDVKNIYSPPDFLVVLVEEKDLPLVSIGSSYIDGEFIPPKSLDSETSQEDKDKQLASIIRLQRNNLLLESDFVMLYDNLNSMSEEVKTQWIDYRQALRDLTLQEGFPNEIIWPEKP